MQTDGLLDAERTVTGALLGDPFLDKERAQWVISAACENEGKVDILARCAAVAVDREKEITILRECLHSLKHDAQSKHDVWCRVELEAKGLQLARRIVRGDSLVHPENEQRGSVAWGSVILHAARFVDDAADEKFWQRVRQEAGGESVWHVGGDVLVQISNRDVGSFDRYLSFLLGTVGSGGERAAEAGRRIRNLCEQDG